MAGTAVGALAGNDIAMVVGGTLTLDSIAILVPVKIGGDVVGDGTVGVGPDGAVAGVTADACVGKAVVGSIGDSDRCTRKSIEEWPLFSGGLFAFCNCLQNGCWSAHPRELCASMGLVNGEETRTGNYRSCNELGCGSNTEVAHGQPSPHSSPAGVFQIDRACL